MENKELSMVVADATKDLFRKTYREAAKVIVTGGRDFSDFEFMKENLEQIFWFEDFCGDSEIKIISGMEDGADTLALRFADEFKLTKILFPANRKGYHQIAGFLRNEDMMEGGGCHAFGSFLGWQVYGVATYYRTGPKQGNTL